MSEKIPDLSKSYLKTLDKVLLEMVLRQSNQDNELLEIKRKLNILEEELNQVRKDIKWLGQ